MQPYYPSFLSKSFVRTPDWRWQRACWHVDHRRNYSRKRDDTGHRPCRVVSRTSQLPQRAPEIAGPWTRQTPSGRAAEAAADESAIGTEGIATNDAKLRPGQTPGLFFVALL